VSATSVWVQPALSLRLQEKTASNNVSAPAANSSINPDLLHVE